MPSKKDEYLKLALENYVVVPRPERILVNEEATKWVRDHGVEFYVQFLPSGETRGFSRMGAEAINSLASILFWANPAYRFGTNLERLSSAVADGVFSVTEGKTTSDVASVERHVEKWFAQQSFPKTFLIPCSISPYEAHAFSVGPVVFQTKKSLLDKESKKETFSVHRHDLERLFEFMDERGANWVAEVRIERSDFQSASFKADLAVDLSLTALQLVIPVVFSREVARITGRTIPKWVGSIYRSGESLRSSIHRNDPCFSLSEEVFSECLFEKRPILDSVGHRIESFINGVSELPNLEQAWCDAAYWLHEGLSERLDMIAITKIETAIEVLLCAESTKGSSSILKEAFRAFYHLEENQPLISGHNRTTKQFISSIVTARSRILHGTLSTLVPDIGQSDVFLSRDEIEWLGVDLISRYAVELNDYMKDDTKTDNIEKFLRWIEYKPRDLNDL